jgi:glycosyltransferase involved in cell wall biosynthesis
MAKARLFADYFAKQDQKRVGQAYRWVYDHSDAFVMLSESYRTYLKEAMGIANDEKLVAINNPLTFNDISDASVLPQKEKVILVVSRMYEWHKRISLCLKAWERLSTKESMQDWRMMIVGTGVDMPTYEQYVKEHSIKRISFLGQQSPEPYYNMAKIFLMASEREGWGLTITEAMQRGVVPVAFDTTSAFHDIITDGENGFLVKEGELKTFASKIEQLASNKQLWKEMAEKALASANRFSLDRIINEWEKIIA